MYQLTPPQLWRQQRTSVRQARYRENGSRRTEQLAGYFTAASGGTAYNGDAFPREYVGDVFTGEVAGNLVRHDKLTPAGATFTAHPAKAGVEFLASSDVWFRPCNFANAPDGNLYMLDFYREVIESPEYIPDAIKKLINFHNGEDKGRIYRIAPNHPLRHGDLKASLGSASSPELVKQLENPNGWNRDTAHRLLLEKQDRASIPLLKQLARNSTMAQGRLQALWALEGIGGLDPVAVITALHDPEPHVREHALRLSEPFLRGSKDVADAVLALQKDSEPRVRFQLALSVGRLDGARPYDALAALASAGGAADHWMRIAILSSASERPFQLFDRLKPQDRAWQKAAFVTQLAALIGAKHDSREMASLITELPQIENSAAGLTGLAHGLKLAGVRNLNAPEVEAALSRLTNGGKEETQSAAWEVARYFELHGLLSKAADEAKSSDVTPALRVAAIRALSGGRFATVAPALRAVLDSPGPPVAQKAAVETLASFNDAAIGPMLLSYWRTYQAPARATALDALLNTRDRAPLLLDAVERKEIPAASLEISARNRLLEYPDPRIAARAKKLLQTEGEGRDKVVENYHGVIAMQGDATRGKEAFEKTCARCHLARRGQRVGPDLSGVNNKAKEELLNSILNPSAAIEPRFVNYIVTTKDGRIHDGVIAAETPGMITLRNGSEDGDDLILRSNIAEMRASAVSLMPEDLEKSLSRQDLADVLAYLRGGT